MASHYPKTSGDNGSGGSVSGKGNEPSKGGESSKAGNPTKGVEAGKGVETLNPPKLDQAAFLKLSKEKHERDLREAKEWVKKNNKALN